MAMTPVLNAAPTSPHVTVTARFDIDGLTAEHMAELLLLVPADARLAFPQRQVRSASYSSEDEWRTSAVEASWSVPFGQPLTPPNVLDAELAEFEPAEVWVLSGELARDPGHHDLLPLPLAFDSKEAAEAYMLAQGPLDGSSTLRRIEYATGGLLPATDGDDMPLRHVNCPCDVAPIINVASVHGSPENAERMRAALKLQAETGRA